MLCQFEKTIASFIEANRLFTSPEPILLAISGGADSTALLHAFSSLKTAGTITSRIVCGHVNHRLRDGDSDADERFVIEQARRLGVGVTTEQVDVRGFAATNKMSIETAARQLRLESLVKMAGAHHCKWIATAHQKDDNAETLIQRLARGTAFRGLAGIQPAREAGDGIFFVRPMLCVRRDEVIDYLKQHNLTWRVDHTNYDLSYRRNFIRHRLIPSLQAETNGCLVDLLGDLAQAAAKLYRQLTARTDAAWATMAAVEHDRVVLDLAAFGAEPVLVQAEIIRRALQTLRCGQRKFTRRHYNAILQLACNATAGTVTLPNGFAARRIGGQLVLSSPRAQRSEAPQESIEINIPGTIRFGRYLVEATTIKFGGGLLENFKKTKSRFVEWFDFDRLRLPLLVRRRRAGDRFQPLGLGARKKVGKFLTGQRLSRELREKALVVADAEKIIWVWPIRPSEESKVTAQTRTVLQLRITEAGNEQRLNRS